MQVFFSVSNKISPILGTLFFGNKLWKVSKKSFSSASKKSGNKEKEKKEKTKLNKSLEALIRAIAQET